MVNDLTPIHDSIVYSIQIYMIKFVSNLCKVNQFPAGTPIFSTTKIKYSYS